MINIMLYILGILAIFFFVPLLLITYGGGLGYSIVMILWSLFAYQNKESSLFADYKRIKNSTNPLYAAGCYRETDKKRRDSWYEADLKGFYWIQIVGRVQAVLFLIYGIFTIFVRRYELIEFIMFVMTVGLLLISSSVQSHYDRILKKGLDKKLWKGKKERYIWEPFNRVGEWENTIPISAETAYHTFPDIENVVQHSLNKKEYQLFKRYSARPEEKWDLYYKEAGKEVFIFLFREELDEIIDEELKDLRRRAMKREISETVWMAAVDKKNPNRKIDKMLKDFFLEQFGTVRLKKDVFLMLVTCGEITKPFTGEIMTPIRQTRGHYWLKARLSLATGVLAISRQKKRYGQKQYQKMKEELLELLGVSDKYGKSKR